MPPLGAENKPAFAAFQFIGKGFPLAQNLLQYAYLRGSNKSLLKLLFYFIYLKKKSETRSYGTKTRQPSKGC